METPPHCSQFVSRATGPADAVLAVTVAVECGIRSEGQMASGAMCLTASVVRVAVPFGRADCARGEPGAIACSLIEWAPLDGRGKPAKQLVESAHAATSLAFLYCSAAHWIRRKASAGSSVRTVLNSVIKRIECRLAFRSPLDRVASPRVQPMSFLN